MSKEKELYELITDDSFVRWLRGQASEEEELYWENWALQSSRRQDLIEEAREFMRFTRVDDFVIPDPRSELLKLESSINYFEHQKPPKANNWYKSNIRYGAVAAGLIVLVVSIYFLLGQRGLAGKKNKAANRTQKFHTNYGEKISIKLSDGSLIVLNAHSHLKYSSSLDQNQKIDVWLKGEAYFDIPHLEGQKKRIFAVHTEDGTIRDLGTRFAVKTSPNGTQSVLEEGGVKVLVNDGLGNESLSELHMKPGEKASFSSGKQQVDVKRVNPLVYTSWVDNKLVFDNTPFSEVAQRIENTYGVKVVVNEHQVQTMNLSGSIKSTNLDILKQALEKILHEPVRQQGEILYIGSVSK